MQKDLPLELFQVAFLSPLGWIGVKGTAQAIHSIHFSEKELSSDVKLPDVLHRCREQLEAYFVGKLLQFDLPVALNGTPFQQEVWQSLKGIPFGQTSTYQEIGHQLGKHGASRAVGLANGRNPLAIVIPCHRVIGADGTLTGYAGGLWRKKWLLQHEGHPFQGELDFAAEGLEKTKMEG